MLPKRLYSGLLALVLAAATLLSGCGYSTCGTFEYATPGRTDPDHDTDLDGDLDLLEACGDDYGSFGQRFVKERIVSLLFDWSEWDTAKGVDITYDYLPGIEVTLREELLVKGAVLGVESIRGQAQYRPGGGGENEARQWFELSQAEVEVLDGPEVIDTIAVQGTRWKLRWRLVFGVTEARPEGAVRAEGEDWVRYDDALWDWDPNGHGGHPPGYPRP